MDFTTLEVTAGALNFLHVPPDIRNYVNEQGEGRSFNLDSFSVIETDQPRQVIIEFRITPTGAEQLEPFTVNFTLGKAAANQLTKSLLDVQDR